MFFHHVCCLKIAMQQLSLFSIFVALVQMYCKLLVFAEAKNFATWCLSQVNFGSKKGKI